MGSPVIDVPTLPSSLIDAHADNRLIPWIGSGLSSAIVGEKLPDYGELIRSIADTAKTRVDETPDTWLQINELVNKGDFKLAAERLRAAVPNDTFTLIIRDLLRSSKPRPSQHHVMLNLMNFPIFLTTNYDRVLDQIVRPRPEVLTYRDAETLNALLTDRSSLYRDGEAPKIFKLNGDLAAPPTIVLGQAEKVKLFDETHPLGAALVGLMHRILSQHSLIFMGYSFEDPDYRALLMKVGMELGPSLRNHFALVPNEQLEKIPQREALENRAGITFLGFDLDRRDEDGDLYRGLWQFLSQIPKSREFKPEPGRIARTFFPGSERPKYLRMQDEFEQQTDVFRFITPTLTNGFATHEYLSAAAPKTLQKFEPVVDPKEWPTWQSEVVALMKSRSTTFTTRLRAGAEARILCDEDKLINEIAQGDETVLHRYAYVLKWLDDPDADVELRLFSQTEDSVSLTSFASLMRGNQNGSDIAVAYATQATVATFNSHVFEMNTEFAKDMLVLFEREWARSMPSQASAEVIRDGLCARGMNSDLQRH